MYLPEMFAVTDEAEIDGLLAGVGLACLVSHDPAGLYATHLPLLHDRASGVLSGHVSRANPHWRRAAEASGMAIFQGLDAYVTPSWYPSKSRHGQAVPTWNYEVAHVHGMLRWRDDQAWLRTHLAALTDRFEAGRAKPWAMEDAPEDYLQRMIGGVVGLELTIERIEAKRKLSQNRTAPDRLGVIAGLSDSGSERDRAMAETMSRGG